MKHFCILTVLMIFQGLFPCSAQETKPKNPLADAITYLDAYNSNDYQRMVSILEYYRGDNVEMFQESLNPWIPINDSIVKDLESFSSMVSEGIPEFESKALPEIAAEPIESLSTSLIGSLSSLIASRFKEELSIAFLEGFRDKLKSDKDLQALFPTTLNVLLNEDVFNTSLWLTTLRAALDVDLQNLPNEIPHLLKSIGKKIKNEKIEALVNLAAELYDPTVQFIKDPNRSYLLVKSALNQLNVKAGSEALMGPDLQYSLRITTHLIKELGNKAGTDWIRSEDLKKLKDPELLKTFYGLILEKYKTDLSNHSITIDSVNTNLYVFLSEQSRVQATLTYLKGIVEGVLKVAEEREVLKQKIDKAQRLGQKVDLKDYFAFGESVFAEIQRIVNLNWLKGVISVKKLENLRAVLNDIEKLFPFATSIKESIETRSYSLALVGILNYLPEVIDQDKLDKSVVFAEFLKYANLAAGLASAKTAEEMANVINAAALPVQSYRLKRKSPFSITLNAYAGGFYGVEKLNNEQVKNETAGLLAFAAPVGVGFNWALGTKYKDGKFGSPQYENEKLDEKSRYLGRHSLSLFVSVIDIGALAGYRLKDDQSPVGEIEMQNVFAPGAQLIFGFGRTPLSLGAGIQYGPELRRVEGGDNALTPVIESRGWRFGVSLLVDIPLLEIHKKAARVKTKSDREK